MTDLIAAALLLIPLGFGIDHLRALIRHRRFRKDR